jgi:hypothetical protein
MSCWQYAQLTVDVDERRPDGNHKLRYFGMSERCGMVAYRGRKVQA